MFIDHHQPFGSAAQTGMRSRVSLAHAYCFRAAQLADIL